jgi:beta-lactamase class D
MVAAAEEPWAQRVLRVKLLGLAGDGTAWLGQLRIPQSPEPLALLPWRGVNLWEPQHFAAVPLLIGLLLGSATAATAAPWREEPAVAALFRQAGVQGTFVLLDADTGELRGYNRPRAEQRFSPASSFKIPNSLIGLALGAVKSVDEQIPYTGDANPLMREWLEPMGLRGAIRVSNVPLYQELARRIGLSRMHEALVRLRYGNAQIGDDVASFWLRAPLAISAVEQIRFLAQLAHQSLPYPNAVQQQVAEITLRDSGPGWSLHAKTGWQNAPGAGVGWWVGWVKRGDRITPFALNLAMAGSANAPKREQLGRASLQALGVLPPPSWRVRAAQGIQAASR